MFNKFKRILFYPVFKFNINYWKLFKKTIKGVAVIMFILAAFIIIRDEIDYRSGTGYYAEDETQSREEVSSDDSTCNVFGIELHGELKTYVLSDELDEDGYPIEDQASSDDIVYNINKAESDDNIKAIILEIDSYGGSPVAGEEINQALKNAKKPTVAVIRGAGVSGAYLAAVGANIVFASKYSDVGGIGVTMSYLSQSNQNQIKGLTYNQLSAGKFKDTGDPDKELTPEEKELLMRDVNIMHQDFIKNVAEDRKLDIKKVQSLADGSTMLGQMALENGLVDRIGGLIDAKNYLKEKIGYDIDVCW